MDIQFQWVDFYNEFANKLFAYKNSRTDLVRKVKAIYENTGINMPTLEKDNQLVDIDPFTVFGLFNKSSMREANHAVQRYNDIYRVQMPNITPHVCRHTYCTNMAKSGMNPKTLQYLMGHSDIGVTMNTYTHLGMDDAKDEMIRLQELEDAKRELDKASGKAKPATPAAFKVV